MGHLGIVILIPFQDPGNLRYFSLTILFPRSFQAHADTGFSSEYFDDAKDLLNAIKKDTSWNAGLTVGITPAQSPVSLEVGFRLSQGRGTLRNVTDYQSKVMIFLPPLYSFSIEEGNNPALFPSLYPPTEIVIIKP